METWPLPDGWVWKSLADVCKINPSRPRIDRDDDAPTSFVPMQAVNEQDGCIAQMQTRRYGDVKRGYTYFEENDVLMAKITPSMENGKAAVATDLIDGIGFGTTEFHVFRPREDVLPQWIFHYIRRESFRTEAKSNFRGAVGQQRVPEDFLASYFIPLPYPNDTTRSLAEQRRIVARLEALLGEVREMRQLQVEIEADVGRLMEAVLAEVFGTEVMDSWPFEAALSDLVEINASLVDPTLPEYRDFPHINGEVIEEGTGRLLPYRTAAEDGMRSAKYLFSPGSVLYSKIRPYLRKAVTVDFAGLCSADMYPLALKADDVGAEFLKWALLSPHFTSYAVGESGRARMPKINRAGLFAYQLRYPSISEQDRISDLLKHVQLEGFEMQDVGTEQRRQLDALEQSILAQVFQGSSKVEVCF